MKFLKENIRYAAFVLFVSLSANVAMGTDWKAGTCDISNIFSKEQHESFQRDGFIVVSNLLDKGMVDQLSRLAKVFSSENKDAYGYFTAQKKGVIFDGGIAGRRNETGTTKTKLSSLSTKLFRDVALYSVLPEAAAELMQLDPSTQKLRLLRDVFLAKALEGKSCDWHVDDQSYWPESFQSTASEESGKDQSGINIWVALDDMPAKYGGSMALSAGSHKVPWRHEAYLAIGQNHSSEKYVSMDDMVNDAQKLIRKGLPPVLTCSISENAPEISRRLEENRRDFDIRKGDIMLISRLVFHRTLNVTEEGQDYYKGKGISSLNRYSIRYTPGSAKLPNGWNLDNGLVLNSGNGGRTLDEIVELDGDHWYPKVWPDVEENTSELLNRLVDTKLKDAEQKVAAETNAFRSRIARAMSTAA